EVALGDVDGDGQLDLALTEHHSYAVTVLLGDGRGGFRPAPGSPLATPALPTLVPPGGRRAAGQPGPVSAHSPDGRPARAPGRGSVWEAASEGPGRRAPSREAWGAGPGGWSGRTSTAPASGTWWPRRGGTCGCCWGTAGGRSGRHRARRSRPGRGPGGWWWRT